MNGKQMHIEMKDKRMQARAHRNAFTLVELLIVIAIMGVLIGLLLPAVNAAREAARKSNCANNIKQMSLACLSYESTYHLLPPACNFVNNASGVLNESNQRANWIILVLPFLDQQALFNEINGMLAELWAGIISIDSRGTWSLGGAGQSAIACCGYNGDARGPNAKNQLADDLYGGSKVLEQIDFDQLVIIGMACYNSSNNSQATARSSHPGGVQTTFCDGSVHWISDGISVGTSETDLGVWDKLLLSCDGFSLSSADF
ncbi:MAG: DUF1559 domain-containing protein [Thermoguttaceae bacterium]|nr:DUF1559 domain-containing protein [Thermoguttaceae bacterium]